MHQPSTLTFLFTDIEGSSRLWEQASEQMAAALARHDALLRRAVEQHHGRVVKMLGDGVNAVFEDPLDAVLAILDIQLTLGDPANTAGLPLKVRSGLHAGVVEARDRDFFGSPVNRAARLMSSAHGGQILLSQAVVDLIGGRLPHEVSLRDLGNARLRDLATPERVHQLVHPRLRRDFPALRSLESTPNNLTLQLTSLIGRDREIAHVRELLRRSRLVTLVGPGGIGKTRIARHVAADVINDFNDGVWFVDLAPIADGRLVVSALSNTLGVVEAGERSLLDSVVDHLATHRALIVLDNCEHVLDASAELVTRLLGRAANVGVLATSREPLHLAGEETYVVAALSSPGSWRELTADDLQKYDATRLFIERAVSVQPSFRADARNAAAIADICTRLDGIPLAIELAAARVRALPAETIASRLSDRFRLLIGGDRAALPRQQTLRAAIDWSYDTLNDGERLLLRRLSVFAGSWTLDAAEAVTAHEGVDGADVLQLLSNLVDKSLSAFDATSGRYVMYESIREYARERLESSGDAAAVSVQHLEYYLALAEQARLALYGAERLPWLARLDGERENLMVAHRSCDKAPEGGTRGLRLCVALGEYFYARGALTVLRRMMVEALARPQAAGRTRQRARALFELGQLECFMGHYAAARPPLTECIAIAEEIGDARRIAEALQPLAMAAFGLGDIVGAREHLEKACTLAREYGDKRELAAALTGLVQVLRMDGMMETAEPLCNEVVAIAREIEDREVLIIGLINLAMIALARPGGSGARGIVAEIVRIAPDAGSKPILQSALDVAAVLACRDDDWDRAGRYFAVVESDRSDTALKRDPADDAFVQPFIDRVRARSFPAQPGVMLSEAIDDARAWLCARSS